MKLVLDCGAFIALERGDRAMWRRLKGALVASEIPVTHGGVVGQAWRGKGTRAALLAKALEGVDVQALDADRGRAAGALLAKTRKSDVIDAAVVLLADEGDWIATSGPEDIEPLAIAAGLDVEIVRV